MWPVQRNAPRYDTHMKRTALLLALVVGGSVYGADTVPYPQNFRTWSHVKSGVIGPQHKNFDSLGGLHHVYANKEAMAGYRTRQFPEQSVIVFEWLEWAEKDGAFLEGPRRQVDVMVKDSKRYAATGGWGFQRFVKDTQEPASAPTPQACFACHNQLKEDGLVLSKYRM
jgi:cytochrome P460